MGNWRRRKSPARFNSTRSSQHSRAAIIGQREKCQHYSKGTFEAHFLYTTFKMKNQTAEPPVDDKKWNPDAQVFVPNFLKTKTPEPDRKFFLSLNILI